MSGARALGLAAWATTPLVLVAALGCADVSFDPNAGLDAGAARANDDAAVPGEGGDAALGARLDGGFFATPEGDDRDDLGNSFTCFDGIDQDRDGDLDCSDDACAGSPLCCIGSTDPACCAPTPITSSLDLTECAAGRADRCSSLGARLVSGSPAISADGAIVPVSSAGVDGALDFPQHSLSPRAEVLTLRARIASPVTTAQLDATAFGLWAPALPTSSVTPLVAVVVSATRDDVSVVAGTRVIARTARAAGAVEHVIEVMPDGTATVRVGDEVLGPFSISLPSSRVVPVVFGRVTNDAVMGGTTRLVGLTVERRACDLPSALTGEGELGIDAPAGLDVIDPADPSALVASGGTLVAFSASGGASNDARALWLGTLGAGAIEDVRPLLTTSALEAALGDASEIRALAEPHLYSTDGAIVHAYFAFESAGSWRIGHLEDVLGAATPTALDLGAGSFDGPATLPDGRLLVRERLAGGGSRLARFAVTAGAAPVLESGLCGAYTRCEGLRPDAAIVEPSGEELAFDRDEVAAPFALTHAGVTRIYYAGRRGTRTSIGVLVQSLDATFFRPLRGGTAVLGPDGQGSDGLGISGPSLHVEGDELVLIFTGTDGVRSSLHAARAPIRG